jgi:hypothetical protein
MWSGVQTFSFQHYTDEALSEMTYHTVAIGTTVGILAFAAFVWPTAYRYDHMKSGETSLPVRVHRITGETEILNRSGWVEVEESGTKSTDFKNLPPDEIARLEGTGEVFGSRLTCTVYNRSNWRIREVIVNLKIFDAKSQYPSLDRDYRLSNSYYTEPMDTGLFSDYVWINLQDGQRFEWYIKSAKGARSD